MIDYLSIYEIDFKKLTGIDFEEHLWEDKKPKKNVSICILDGSNSSGNSYNWNSEIIFDWLSISINDEKYIAIKFHISGDVRCNYTDSMIIAISHLPVFFDIIAQATEVTYRFEFNGNTYNIITDAQMESCQYIIYKNF